MQSILPVEGPKFNAVDREKLILLVNLVFFGWGVYTVFLYSTLTKTHHEYPRFKPDFGYC